MQRDILLIAGEASADLHGAALLHQLRGLTDDKLRVWGVGGTELEGEGMEIVASAKHLNVVGGSDWAGKAEEVVSTYQTIKTLAGRNPPDLAILLDLPDFNLALSKVLHSLGVPICYYISPQVWAWRKYRIKTIQKYIDQMLVVFPFEEGFYRRHGVDAQFVGHPLVDRLSPREAYRSQTEIDRCPRIAILPGSRESEIRFHAPIVRETIQILRRQFPKALIQIPVPPTLALEHVAQAVGDGLAEYVRTHSHEVLKWADAALVASGTATLETALIGTPFALFYRVSASSHFLFSTFARYRGYIGMPDLLAEKEIVKEFFQGSASPEALAKECESLLRDAKRRDSMVSSFENCRKSLGSSGKSRGASQRAAEQVFRKLQTVPIRGMHGTA